MTDYMKTSLGILMCLLILECALVNSEECPPSEDIYPCFCIKGTLIDVFCRGVSSNTYLKSVMAGLRGYKIKKLLIEDSNLGDVPGNLFKGLHIFHIEFMSTKLTSLGNEANPPFTGLEDSLEYLTIFHEKLLTNPLRLGHLKKLEYIYFGRLEIPNLGNDWLSEFPQSVDWLNINHCEVKHVGLKAFSHLANLKSFSFKRNNVMPPRSALPEKAVQLMKVSLTGNRIQEIPPNFFKDMPALRSVDLDDNALTSIPQDTWESIWPQLTHIDLNDNPMVCDSNLKWIFNYSRTDLRVQCAMPQRLKGRHLMHLRVEELE